MENTNKLRGWIYESYPSYNALAQQMGWSRQRLGRLVNCEVDPTLSDVASLAECINRPVGELVEFFLASQLPKGNKANGDSEVRG